MVGKQHPRGTRAWVPAEEGAEPLEHPKSDSAEAPESGWSNWSASVECQPERSAEPTNEGEIAEEVRRAAAAGKGLRVAGSGHSMSPLVASAGSLLHLGAWAGIESCDPETRRATVRAGSVLHDLGDPLLDRGLCFQNLGDIDVQAVAGALSTGTHGTGPALGNLASRVDAMRFIDARGEVVECGAERDDDLLLALRVSLGALGVLSAARLRLVPAYRLHERIWRVPAEECLEELAERIARHRHFEFFWYPPKDRAEMKSLDLCGVDSELEPGEGERIGWAPHILPSVRELRFNEMEYAVPAALGPACFAEVRERMRERHADVLWPVEYRTFAKDDAYLSTAQGRETVTISIHQDARLPFRDLFSDLEPIFRQVGGRPHWGKVHTSKAAYLRTVYPHWERFQIWRERLDPDGVFLNDHLRSLFLEDA